MLLPFLTSLLLCALHSVPALDAGDRADSRAGGAAAAADYEAALTEILGRVVTPEGRVQYDLLRGTLNHDFRRVLRAVEDFDAASLATQEARLAFWMNAYNVQMLQHIVETPGVQNIIEDGFSTRFFQTPYRTARTDLTLDELEHVILRRQEGPARLEPLQVPVLDPRIHVGLNCAAVSCPRLRERAFTADNVHEELEAAMRDFVNSPAHFRVEDGRIILSALLDWFGEDFDSQGRPAGDFLLGYMSASRPGYGTLRQLLQGRTAAQIKAQPEVRFAYLWTVNRAGS